MNKHTLHIFQQIVSLFLSKNFLPAAWPAYLFPISPGLLLVFTNISFAQINGQPWKIHTIDKEGFGADGVRLYQHEKSTIFTVSWEQSGYSRLYFFNRKMKKKWVWQVPSVGVEDALTADLNGDGVWEVLTFQELPANQIQWHRPHGKGKKAKVESQVISGDLKQEWMYGEVHDFNGDGKKDVVAGSKWVDIEKSERAGITLFLHPEKESGLWQSVRLAGAGWVMSIKLLDVDTDGDMDILYSDRRGESSGVHWLENPGRQALTQTWEKHLIGLEGMHPFFLNAYKIGFFWEIYASEKDQGFYKFLQKPDGSWQEEKLFAIPEGCGKWVKDIALADLDGHEENEIVTAYNEAHLAHGIIYSKKGGDGWEHFAISGLPGPKFDLLLFADMDNDGDLDVLNTEENDNSDTEAGLGFVWYENPIK
jgi:hypothetical protein